MKAWQKCKFALKLLIAHVLYWSGILQLWQYILLRRKAIVFMYHRVLPSDDRTRTGSHPGIVVDRDAFDIQMRMLKKHFKVLSLDEFAEKIEQKVPYEDASCLITFDDGWRDNYTHALPILRHHGIPAVIFLPVSFIGEERLFWQEYLTHLTLQALAEVRCDPSRRGRLGELLAPVGLESMLDLQDRDPRFAIMHAVRGQKQLAPSLINTTLEAVSEELGVRQEDYKELDGFLDWKQVASMARQGIAFGGHGADHRILTFVSSGEAWDEIRTSKKVIDSRIPRDTWAFSYPNGNWSPDLAKLVQDAGYRLAFTTERGYVSCEDDRFAIRRTHINEWLMNSKPLFLARIVGLF